MEKKIELSVRALVEFVLRSGDIDRRFTGSVQLAEGAAAHRRIQKAAGEEYQPEVTLAYEFEYAGFAVRLDGRADGVIEGPDGIVVDEIKSTARPLEEIPEEGYAVHWAQAVCYAFMLARLKELAQVGVQLTYCEVDGDGIRRFRRDYSEMELTVFVHGLFDRYVRWAEYDSTRKANRDAAIRALGFPFEQYRAGQRAFAASVYRAAAGGKVLFAQAPTGIGKTVSTLFPAVKAIGEGQIAKIFYLTAKTVTRQVAENGLRCMRGLGDDFKSVTLTARDKICPCPGTPCDPEHCTCAKGYYDRVNDALYEFLGKTGIAAREDVAEFAAQKELCPFEFGLDLSEWTDCIICDYNYVFDPFVSLRRYFQNASGDYLFLVDEAHNLAGRAREMYSAKLEKASFLQVNKTYKGKNKGLAKAASALNRYFLELRRQCLEEKSACIVRESTDAELSKLLSAFLRQADRQLEKNPSSTEDGLLDLYFESLRFSKILEFYDETYRTLIRADGGGASLKLFCLDPSGPLADTLKLGKSAVFFSATLSPPDYYRRLLGGTQESPTLRLPSPFEQDRLCLLVADTISTRYKHRAESLPAVSRLILGLVEGRPGNYIAYFPSYQYMTDVYEEFLRICPEGIETVRQDSGMTDAEREDFLNRFRPGSGTLLGFCVLGGAFSEGIDLTGDRLIGTAVVGVGLPQLNPEEDLIRSHFDAINGMGYEYAYEYPGMNKVLQAAGRVIRTAEDRGVVLLIDDRFTRRDYLALFPPHWRHFRRVRDSGELGRELKRFWDAENR